MPIPCVPAGRTGPAASRRGVAAALLSVAAALLALPVPASPASGADAAPHDVRSWLVRIHEAASRHSFQGTFVASVGGAVSSARIARFGEGANQYERSETLDGEPRRVFRHNEVVVTAWPASHVATVEQRDGVSQFPALLQAGDDGIADRYQLIPQGVERVAGRDANVAVVQPRDALRYGYRLWADRASGLLLRVDTLGEHKEVLESSAFSDVAIDVKLQPESVLLPMRKLDGYHVLHPAMTPTRLEAEGWSMRDTVPGFRQVSCVRRPPMAALSDAAPTPAAAPGGHPPEVVQAIFSDGLTYVSVFIEPLDPSRSKTPVQTAMGATQTLMQPQGDSWITLMGDVPPATLRLFAQGLERRK